MSPVILPLPAISFEGSAFFLPVLHLITAFNLFLHRFIDFDIQKYANTSTTLCNVHHLLTPYSAGSCLIARYEAIYKKSMHVEMGSDIHLSWCYIPSRFLYVFTYLSIEYLGMDCSCFIRSNGTSLS